jgi:hypothetical protein
MRRLSIDYLDSPFPPVTTLHAAPSLATLCSRSFRRAATGQRPCHNSLSPAPQPQPSLHSFHSQSPPRTGPSRGLSIIGKTFRQRDETETQRLACLSHTLSIPFPVASSADPGTPNAQSSLSPQPCLPNPPLVKFAACQAPTSICRGRVQATRNVTFRDNGCCATKNTVAARRSRSCGAAGSRGGNAIESTGSFTSQPDRSHECRAERKGAELERKISTGSASWSAQASTCNAVDAANTPVATNVAAKSGEEAASTSTPLARRKRTGVFASKGGGPTNARVACAMKGVAAASASRRFVLERLSTHVRAAAVCAADAWETGMALHTLAGYTVGVSTRQHSSVTICGVSSPCYARASVVWIAAGITGTHQVVAWCSLRPQRCALS